MKYRSFSILTALSITLTFMACSLPQYPKLDPQQDLQNDPQQKDFSDDEKAQHKTRPIFNIQYSPDGTKLAVAGLLGIRLCDANTGKELDFLTMAKYIFVPISVAYSPDGKTLTSVSADKTLRHKRQFKKKIAGFPLVGGVSNPDLCTI